MRGARWRKVRADLLTNKLRSGLAVMSLAVGTTAVGAMYLAGAAVDASFESSFSAANPPTAVLVTDPFDPELVSDVAAHPAAGQVEGRRLHRTQTTGPNGETVSVELVAMADFDHNQVARIEPLTGTWPPEPGHVVLERASTAELGAELGDKIVVERPGEPPVQSRQHLRPPQGWREEFVVCRRFVALARHVQGNTGVDDESSHLVPPATGPRRTTPAAQSSALRGCLALAHAKPRFPLRRSSSPIGISDYQERPVGPRAAVRAWSRGRR